MPTRVEVWHGPLQTTDGRSYFVNSATGESSKHDPRADTQFTFDLESKLLDELEDRLPTPRTLRNIMSPPAARRENSPGLPAFGRPDSEPGSPVSPVSPTSAEIVSPPPVTPRLEDKIKSLVGEMDAKSALQKLGQIHDRFHAACCDETEAQLLQISNKAKLRSMRRRRRTASKESSALLKSGLPRFYGHIRCHEKKDSDCPP